MDMDEFAQRVELLRPRLYQTAYCYLGSEAAALDILDEAVYRGLKGAARLREPAYFDTWMTRILINECHREQKRRKKLLALEERTEIAAEELDRLPLKEAIINLPKELKDVIILRFFSDYTLSETAEALQIPQGTVVTRQRRALQLLRLDLEEVPL